MVMETERIEAITLKWWKDWKHGRLSHVHPGPIDISKLGQIIANEATVEQRKRDAGKASGYEAWAMKQLDLANRHDRIETAKDIERAIRDDTG